jgi:diguanylate cyclase (GGDEF)-like protein/PAS domain S-box-containing protein
LSPEEILEELRVHQVELEMQNDELRRTQLALEESRDRYVDLYEFSPVGYLTLDGQALITQANLTAAALLGEDRRKLVRRRFAHFVASEDRDRWHRSFVDMMLRDTPQSLTLDFQRADGTGFPARLQCVRMPTKGESSSLRVALTDITQLARAEEELRIAASAFESSEEAMMVADAKGIVVRVNGALTRLTGYRAEEVQGQSATLLKSERHDDAFYGHLWAVLHEVRFWLGELWIRRKDGGVFAAWLTISAVSDPQGRITHYVGSCSDITEKAAAEAVIYGMAYYDLLTALPNRRLLQDRLAQALAASERSGRHGAILFVDLDHFKAVNDTYGHDAGDVLLVEVGKRLQAHVRKSDTVARLGGDEFVVMLQGLSAEGRVAAVQAKQWSEKIMATLAEPYVLEQREVHGTASMGVALFRGGERGEDLLTRADLAMYEAKRSGRGVLRFFESGMQAAVTTRSALIAELREALERRQFLPYYQPQIDGSGRIIGAESLLRWRHAERGLILPGEFIVLAEESGLVVPIDQWVLRTACIQLKAWQGLAHTRDLRLAVNVSVRQFRQPDFVEQVREALRQTEADPARMRIELGEGHVIDDLADTLEKMRALKALGIGFSMEDFGTGYSSLSCLARLPFDQIKIDQSFVRNLDEHNRVMVQTIVRMARSLGLSVVAEGMETEAQREFLDRQACDAFQGNLVSLPLPLDEFERYVTLRQVH